MTTPKKGQPAATTATAPDQENSQIDQKIAAEDQSIAVEDQKTAVEDLATADKPQAEAEAAPAEKFPEFIKLRAVYSLAVRHPDAQQPDGSPLIFSRTNAVQLPGYTIDPTSPKRDQWIIDIIGAGYLERADV